MRQYSGSWQDIEMAKNEPKIYCKYRKAVELEMAIKPLPNDELIKACQIKKVGGIFNC